jgi:hypothetical protein
MVATRWGDVLCELWAEEMLGWHGVWSGYEGRVTCVALRQGWMVATRRDDVMHELWALKCPAGAVRPKWKVATGDAR